MTHKELMNEMNKQFGFSKWPDSMEVDADTYGNVCQYILDRLLEVEFPDVKFQSFGLPVRVGPNNGLMFKGVELILKGYVKEVR